MPHVYPIRFDNGLKIHYTVDCDGGGSLQYKDFIDYLNKLDKKYETCLEWCAGLGAIGFSLFDAKICNNLYLMDRYVPAMYVSQMNIAYNNLQDNVKFYLADAVNELPKALKFDLVVANPPHNYQSNPTDEADTTSERDVNRLCLDLDWATHKEFFDNISQYLVSGADIILSEITDEGSLLETHVEFAKQNNIELIAFVDAPVLKSFGSIHAKLVHYRYIGP
jgi:methylase of polypeptide subunit release factors